NLFKLEDQEHKIYSRIPGPSLIPFRFISGVDSMEKDEVGRRTIQVIEEADQADTAEAGRPRDANHELAAAKLSEARLRQKLQARGEYLRSVVEQHEAYTEELQSANEELLSANEELQSVSEELETAKRELQLSNDQLKQDKEKLLLQTKLIQSSFEPVTVWDIDNGIVEWNEGCERLYGFTRAEAVGRSIHNLLRTVHPAPLEEVKARLLAHAEWMGELRQTTKDGREVIVESRRQLSETGGLRLVLETNRDITERE